MSITKSQGIRICSEVVVFISREGLVCSIGEFVLHGSDLLLINLDILGSEHWSFNEDKVSVVNESAEQPDEWLFKLVVALR